MTCCQNYAFICNLFLEWIGETWCSLVTYMCSLFYFKWINSHIKLRHSCSSTESDYEKYLDIIESMKEMYSILTWKRHIWILSSYGLWIGIFFPHGRIFSPKQSCTIEDTYISFLGAATQSGLSINSFSYRSKGWDQGIARFAYFEATLLDW